MKIQFNDSKTSFLREVEKVLHVSAKDSPFSFDQRLNSTQINEESMFSTMNISLAIDNMITAKAVLVRAFERGTGCQLPL